MINAAIAVVCMAIVLLLSEILWRKAHIRGEFARKFVHILAGVLVAFLPFWVSYDWIAVLGIFFVIAMMFNRYTPIFNAIHTVKRKSWGDLLAGVAGVTCALIKPSPWVFAGAILQVSLADGMAAVIGTHYAKTRYKVFDHDKSPIGTAVFYLGSFTIICILLFFGNLKTSGAVPVLVVVPLALTLLENVSGFGSDNLTLPIGFLLLLKLFRVS